MYEQQVSRSRDRQIDLLAQTDFARDATDLGDHAFICITVVNPDDAPPPPPPPPPAPPPPPPPPPDPDADPSVILDSSGYPQVAQSYFYCQICSVGGTQTAGAAGSVTPIADRFLYALNLGPKPPPLNTYVLVHSNYGRAVFRYNG